MPPPLEWSTLRNELQAWCGTVGDWDTAILPKFEAALSHMKEDKGAEVVGVVGFCWGGKMAMKAASLGVEGGVKAAGCVHPAMLSPELAEDVGALGCTSIVFVKYKIRFELPMVLQPRNPSLGSRLSRNALLAMLDIGTQLEEHLSVVIIINDTVCRCP